MIHHWALDYIGLSGVVEFVPIDWLRKLSPRQVDPHTEISPGVFGDIAALTAGLQTDGLLFPGVIEVSRETKKARLIFGNHRLLVFKDLGYKTFPVYAAVVDKFEITPGESGFQVGLKSLPGRTGALYIVKPSEILDFSNV